MAKYRRTATRAPRAIEQTEAMLERDALRTRAEALALRNHQLLLQNNELARLISILQLEVDRADQHKAMLGREIRNLRIVIDFLEGRMGPGWLEVARTRWISKT